MMNPYISWALLLVVAGGLGWYYNGPTPKQKTPIVEKTEIAPAVKKPKRKAKKSPEPSPAPSKQVEEKPAAQPTGSKANEVDEEIDKKEMAKRFAAVKNGVSMQAPAATKAQKKKKGKVAQVENGERSTSRVSTRTSSTTGADADDDLSPAASPLVNATSSPAGYVSDMLEEPAPGASVLRVTGSMAEAPKKQKPQSFKQVETKKQRQQRLKNEARKQQVQEAEVERRKLLEKQLHLAREAERREAAQSKPAAPQTNAWQTKTSAPATNGTPKSTPSPKVELLDTFVSDAPVAQASSKKQWDQGLPSEEEQLRILGAENVQDQWTTVPSKGKKPKKKGGKTDESEVSAPESQPAPAVAAPVPVEPKVTVTPTYLPDILRSNVKGHPLDSDWAA
ncbi:hypothetical protein BO70DRAFT_294802 [Aspergillus heteromorphus CBS 117.55]|uniref:Inner centromere protein ARK-binding domain-containing protein n=1 Tax=Aspergillus heteromorphus CBS 117.55 TaxID=1448321 RepID=A0A317VTZ5_9EURO|nr:uncharacterized protein BO70DRAFT_294802 [Aspergillus heteromorphus CBS 117.55]PWY77335.1 hypothetical protein BO70DRAFT_294802 [Aspergillus heteromorphus CBS 117.55]